MEMLEPTNQRLTTSVGRDNEQVIIDSGIKQEVMSQSQKLPETRQVLLEHMQTKLRHLCPGQEETLTHLIGKSLSISEILDLLQSDEKLEAAAQAMQPFQQDGSLEEAVFARVSGVDSELCAQLTGMLLEETPLRLARLLQDQTRLAQVVHHARVEYLRFTAAGHTDHAPPSRENLGDRLYARLGALQPQLAAQLTGMLLELPEDEVAALLTDGQLLQQRTRQALGALGR